MILNHKGQTWFLDYILAFTFFIVVVVMVLHLLPDFRESEFDMLQREVVVISDSLVSEGVPTDWHAGNYIRPGLLNTSFRLDQERIDEFSNINPSEVRTALGLRGDYSINFTYVNGTSLNICGNCTSSTDSYDNLATIKRLVVYNSTIIIMQVNVFV